MRRMSAPDCLMTSCGATTLPSDFDRAVALLAHENGDRHAPGTLARDHPVRAALDHAGDAVLARRRNPAGDLDRFERAMAQRVALVLHLSPLGRGRKILIQCDEP